MLNSFQRLSAASVLVATVGGVSASTTDINVTVKNQLGIAVVVTIDNKDSTIGAGDEQKTSTIGTKGKSVHWKAKPSNESEKSQFATCEGDAKISDKGVIILEKGSNTKCVPAAAPKPATPARNLSPQEVEKAIIRVEHIITFENKSKHDAELWLWDFNAGQHMVTTTIPINGTWTFHANVQKAALALRVALHCKRPGENPPYSVDSQHYVRAVGSIQINDADPKTESGENSSDPLLCRLSPKGG